MGRSICRTILCLFALFASPARTFARPPTGPYQSFRIKTDNIPQAEIDGWVLPATHPRGTVFVLHGYGMNKEDMTGWEWMRDRENWNVVMFDFRQHGHSTRNAHLCTLGYYEIWDVKAAVDHAESLHLAKPYVIYGTSMGAAVGLRWAAMDPRISGVLAVSPYKNAYVASQELPAARLHLDILPSPFALSLGFRNMLEQVDIPQAVAKRSDLRIWILSGDRDCFTPEDQRDILSASHSPDSLKRLVIAPGFVHGQLWAFKGDATHPSHDQYIHDFLAASRWDSARSVVPWVLGLGAAFVVGLVGLLLFVRRMRPLSPATQPHLPPPASAVDAGTA
jgi:pimeloyl-ACP methyl ester carboxylesterase